MKQENALVGFVIVKTSPMVRLQLYLRQSSLQTRHSRGCTTSSRHVWSGLPASSGIIGPLRGYVKTRHRRSYPNHGNFGVYGVDCEMCYTRSGLELAKVSI